MNPWPVYSEMKRYWCDNHNRLTFQELVWRLPGATAEEIKEGMIEFDLAYEKDLEYQLLPFEPSEDELNEQLMENMIAGGALVYAIEKEKEKNQRRRDPGKPKLRVVKS